MNKIKVTLRVIRRSVMNHFEPISVKIIFNIV